MNVLIFRGKGPYLSLEHCRKITMFTIHSYTQIILCCTYPRYIYVQYLRILLGSFGEEDFQSLHQIFYVQIVFGYYFANNVDGANI